MDQPKKAYEKPLILTESMATELVRGATCCQTGCAGSPGCTVDDLDGCDPDCWGGSSPST